MSIGWQTSLETDADVREAYQSRLSAEANRVLGMLDRESFSRTFGCIDRTYWAWKFTDFPGSRFQEGLCFLSFLYSTPFEGNLLYRNESLIGWLQGGLQNWTGQQHKAGDFDEAYPGERSLAATAFTSFYLSEAFLLIEEQLDADVSMQFKRSLAKAADWLCRNDETHGFLSNHLAAAAAALLHAHRLLGSDEYYQRYRYFIRRILDRQSDEGWYEEYGGADPGYQTHGTFYLARCFQLTEDSELLESLERSCEFLQHFIHPDRSLGGEYASRNTQTYYPAGYEMLSDKLAAARWIASEMRPAILDGSAAGLLSVDPYNYFPLLNNYVFALRANMGRKTDSSCLSSPLEKTYQLYLPKAGLLKVRKQKFDLYVGISKGGVVKLFDRQTNKLKFSSCGYIGKLNNGTPVSSQSFDLLRGARVSSDAIELSAQFYTFSRPVMTPIKFLLFRVFSLVTGRIGTVASWLKRTLVKVLIYRKESLEITLNRQIRVSEDGIELVDRITGTDLVNISELEHKSIFTTIHMGSSRYFIPNELEVPDTIERIDMTDRLGDEVLEYTARISIPGLRG